jgi:quercetin dioxygenase-like cupin family protein
MSQWKRNLIAGAVVAIAFDVSSYPAVQDSDSHDDYRKILLQESVTVADGLEALVREHSYPPGWVAPRHRHDGDLFIYVIDGVFEIAVDGQWKSFRSGDVLAMKSSTVMDARNGSDSDFVKLVVFQIGKPGDPFLVVVND